MLVFMVYNIRMFCLQPKDILSTVRGVKETTKYLQGEAKIMS